MSEIGAGKTRQQRRADAERSIAAILDAAIRVLATRPDASIGEIADAAGVTRQTVYAHFPSRDALLNAVIDHVTAEMTAAIDAAELDAGPPADALVRYLTTSWRTLERYPLLLHVSPPQASDHADPDRLSPILDRLERLVTRGKRDGTFDTDLPTSWLVAATIALAHTAGEEVGAGRMTSAGAIDALQDSVLRLYGVANADAHRT